MKKGGGGGDTVLESRHLVGLFLGVVVLCGVFFTLGYVMGRTQQDTSVRAASLSRDSLPAPASPATQAPAKTDSTAYRPSDWGFYSSGEPNPPQADENHLALPAKKSSGVAGTPGSASTTAAASVGALLAAPAVKPKETQPAPYRASLKAPAIPRGAIILQVAALARETDAFALAEALQKKQFPAFVLTPTSDNLYRVQVGPFADAESATLSKRALEREGFKAITKR